MPSLTQTATILLSLFLFLKLLQIFQKAYLTPLSALPGPYHARFTSLPNLYLTLTKRRTEYIHALHAKYGPYVRIGPDEVVVASTEGYKAIYNNRGGVGSKEGKDGGKASGEFKKHDMFHYFGPTEAGRPPYGLFQMTDVGEHKVRRRLLGRGFTVSALRGEWEGTVAEKVGRAVEGMKREARGEGKMGKVDLRRWWQLMAADVVSEVMFGESFDGLVRGEPDPFFEAIKSGTNAALLAMMVPWVYSVAKRLPVVGRARIFHAHKDLLIKGKAGVGKGRANGTATTLFTKVLDQADKNDGATLNEQEISVEAASFMVAGSDTTSNTLTYLIWAVLSDPNLQALLEEEVAAIQPEDLTDANLEKLPILHAVIQETLRLYGASPGPLPRITPPGGAQIGPYPIPAGTQVSAQAWSLHRDPNIFPNPDHFDYTRYLPSGPATLSEHARAASAAFGGGSRVCIGKNLAYMELRYGAAAFFRECRGARLAAETTEESMEMEVSVLVEPRGGVCMVVLPDL